MNLVTGKNLFYLMHNNDIVTTIDIDSETGDYTKIAPRVNLDLLPLGGNMSPQELRNWWNRRAVPMSQGNVENFLASNGIHTTQSFLVRNLGLSLSDHYWIKPIDSELTWEKVNLFTNDFMDEMGELQFKQTRLDYNKETPAVSFSPSASLQGELRKKWIVDKGKRYLIKGNSGMSYRQSINEVIATKIHFLQRRMPYTKYELCRIDFEDGKIYGCKCESFTSIETEFIPAYDVVSSKKKKNDVSQFEHFIQVCVENGLDKDYVRDFLEYQILVDFLITNVDRHFNNFGVLRDTKTLKFIDVAPIFDSGNSMFWNNPSFPLNHDLTEMEVNSFKKKEIELLKYVKNSRLLDLSKLPLEKEIRQLIDKDRQSAQYSDSIMLGYRKKIELLENFQQGKKIYQFNLWRNK